MFIYLLGNEDPCPPPVCRGPPPCRGFPDSRGAVQCLEKCVGHPSDQHRGIPQTSPRLEAEGLHLQRGPGKSQILQKGQAAGLSDGKKIV